MNIFLAGSESIKGYISDNCKSQLFKDCNILQSFYYIKEPPPSNCKRFMLDSGAFTMQRNIKSANDIERYTDRYIEFINAYDIDLFFEMDIDDIIGLDNVERLRRRIESKTGKQPIPVFHKSRGKEYFINMCKDYPYIAIGGITDANEAKKWIPYMPWFINTAHKYKKKIHGLGFTQLSVLPHIHFDSVDSTSWLYGNKYGRIYLFDKGKIRQFDHKNNTRITDPKRLLIHNFTEWKKLSQYAETHF